MKTSKGSPEKIFRRAEPKLHKATGDGVRKKDDVDGSGTRRNVP